MVGPSLNTPTTTATIKFLCSYGGKILPRYPDGKLRYHGGETRVLAVLRSISFSELLMKMGELCGGSSVTLRCQLPTEDLDALVSITSDEDLANLIEEYDRVSSPPSTLKIRAFLSPPKSAKKISPPPSTAASTTILDASSPRSFYSAGSSSRLSQISKPILYHHHHHHHHHPHPPSAAAKVPRHYAYHGNPSHIYLTHNGNHWQ